MRLHKGQIFGINSVTIFAPSIWRMNKPLFQPFLESHFFLWIFGVIRCATMACMINVQNFVPPLDLVCSLFVSYSLCAKNRKENSKAVKSLGLVGRGGEGGVKSREKRVKQRIVHRNWTGWPIKTQIFKEACSECSYRRCTEA